LRLNTEGRGRFNIMSIAHYILVISALYTPDVPPCPFLQVSGYKKKFSGNIYVRVHTFTRAKEM